MADQAEGHVGASHGQVLQPAAGQGAWSYDEAAGGTLGM